MFAERQLPAALAIPLLRKALDSGESLQVEFKPFIRAVRGDDKAQQIVRTVAAFANTEGGAIIFGVSDNVEPTGILTELRKVYGTQCGGDLEAMQSQYMRDLRKLLADSLGMSVTFDFEIGRVRAHALLPMLRVAELPQKPVALFCVPARSLCALAQTTVLFAKAILR